MVARSKFQELLAATRQPPKEVTIRVKRYDPETGKVWYQDYKVKTFRGMTILDALLQIKEKIDHTIVMRYSCRMGVCGSCGVVVNKKPSLACQTQIAAVASEDKPIVVVEPLYNFPIIRDLVADFGDFFNKHRAIKPYIIRKDPDEVEKGEREFIMDPHDLHEIYEYSLCIMCGLCYSACPVSAGDPLYLGPQALAQAYRFIADVRDEGYEERIKIVDTEHGCHRCHFAATCSAVCPKMVDPASAIQRLRKIVFMKTLGFWKKKKITQIAGPLKEPLRQIEAKYAVENILEGVDPEEQAKREEKIDLEL